MGVVQHKDIAEANRHDPKTHASSHASAGSDPILPVDLPLHAARHNVGGADELTFPQDDKQLSFFVAGPLVAPATKVAGVLWRLDNYTIVECYLKSGQVVTGALTVDVLKNDVTIFSVKPQIATGTDSGSSVSFTSPALTTGDYLHINIDAVGTTSGGGLAITLKVQPV